MSQTILLVDDEPLNLDLLEQELTELGYAIEKADSGRTALNKLAAVSPDLVLLDYQMPGMNGVQVLTEIKKRQAGLPVIMITAYGTIERAVEAIKSGADDFVTKPFDPDHLALVVKKALEQARLKSEVELLARELAGRYRLVAGKSPTMARVIEQAKKAASSKTTVLLLGESGDISAELQTKLLRFLQEREFERVGGTQSIVVDIRIIAATNKDLEEAVKRGTFREDLYHRLNVIAITLPRLRERREDIASLADYFLQRFALETKKPFNEITEQALARLCAYSWPGNVRELANVVERGVVLGDGPEFSTDCLPSRLVGDAPIASAETQLFHEAVNSHRRTLIVDALGRAQGNRAAAAKALGLHRTHLLKLMKALRIS